ncbi:restriction endonuclease subunit S [Acidithiobacillus ferrooxidans]|nr:restriction endonuclease subunit S [Acidithiobacillus ferrooxidans]MCR1344072.1 restriction endonuclease subunit S [Acidithiobacillus ferrooxidans]QLK41281.1 restriction endonuclease subunit S [Acidithiobacillus ferrooxidans]RRN86774.1 MAG: restriction endonuclease subunit S [Acidithiobacillus ferrooxidans]BDB13316.1 restriction endonuclease [Acidithiobacillus ferrooxidans]
MQMPNDWQQMVYTDAIAVNPRVHLAKGKSYSFLDMASVDTSARCALATELRLFTGGGSRFAPGDTLLARITPCLENGKIARYCGPGKEAHGSTEFIVIRGRDNVTDSGYAYYLTKWEGVCGYAISQMTGTSGRQRVPTESLSNLIVPVPPLPEQRRIAHILGTLDDKIENNRKTAKTLEAMAQAIFQSWFVDFDPVRAKMAGESPESICKRLKLTPEILNLFPDRLVDSELGEIPEGWEVKPLESVANFLNGLAMQKFPSRGPEDTLPVIKIAQLRSGSLVGADHSSRDIEPQYIVHDGDILFSWSGSLECVLWSGGTGALNQHLFKVTPKATYPRWIVYFGIHHHLSYFREIAAGKATTMGHIQRHHLSDTVLTIPSRMNLETISKPVQAMFEAVWKKISEAKKLSDIRDTLLPKLISGEIRTPEAEHLIKETAG